MTDINFGVEVNKSTESPLQSDVCSLKICSKPPWTNLRIRIFGVVSEQTLWVLGVLLTSP